VLNAINVNSNVKRKWPLSSRCIRSLFPPQHCAVATGDQLPPQGVPAVRCQAPFCHRPFPVSKNGTGLGWHAPRGSIGSSFENPKANRDMALSKPCQETDYWVLFRSRSWFDARARPVMTSQQSCSETNDDLTSIAQWSTVEKYIATVDRINPWMSKYKKEPDSPELRTSTGVA